MHHPPLSIGVGGMDAFERLDPANHLSLSFAVNSLHSSSLCLATSQPFLRRFESRASQRNALMRTWLPSHFPLRSSTHPNCAATPSAAASTRSVNVFLFFLFSFLSNRGSLFLPLSIYLLMTLLRRFRARTLLICG